MGRRHGRSWIPAAAAVVLLALAVTPARGGADLTIAGAHGSWQRWARASLMPTVHGRITLRLTGCPALPRAAGCVYRARPRTIYLRRGLRRPRAVLLHEMGHLFDLRVMNNSDRGRFRRIMRARKRRWWAGRIPLAEQFAEAYSFCARYRRIVSIARYANYHYRPTPAQHARICGLIVRAAGDRRRAAPPSQAPPVTRADPSPPPQPPSSTVPGSGGKPQPKPTPTPSPTATPGPVPTVPPVPTIPPLPGVSRG